MLKWAVTIFPTPARTAWATDGVHFVNSHNNRDICCFCVVDAFNGLRHNTVICSNNKDRNIGYHRTSGAHGSKGLVSRCVQESNRTAVDLNRIGSDMLCNAARFTGSYICMTNIVKKRCLAVVNVSHNNNDR